MFGAAVKVTRIDRVISINHEFEVASRFFTADTIARLRLGRPRKNVEAANFKAVLLREFGLSIARIVQTIARYDAPLMKNLGRRPHFLLKATAYSGDGEVVYFQEIYISSVRQKLLFDSDLRL